MKTRSYTPGHSDLPVTHGTMIFNDDRTGLSLGVMNAAALTAQRTGAVLARKSNYEIDLRKLELATARACWTRIATIDMYTGGEPLLRDNRTA